MRKPNIGSPPSILINQITKVTRLLLILLAFNYCLTAEGSGEKYSEYEIKAGYLFNFLYFVEWPEPELSANSIPFTICILGESPFDDIMNELETRKVGKRSVIVSKISELTELSSCHIFYISQSESLRLKELLDLTRDKSILSVSDIPEFSSKGGNIGFFSDAGKVRLKINLQAIKKKELKVSAKLLEVAVIVR